MVTFVALMNSSSLLSVRIQAPVEMSSNSKVLPHRTPPSADSNDLEMECAKDVMHSGLSQTGARAYSEDSFALPTHIKWRARLLCTSRSRDQQM